MSASPTAAAARPAAPLKTNSFSRFEPSSAKSVRSRTNTLSDEATGPPMLSSGDEMDDTKTPTATEAPDKRKELVAAALVTEAGSTQSPDVDSFPENFDELPIELQSLTDRFITSLTTAKVYPTPPTVERLSDLFQDFYLQAESHISTHVQELSSRQSRRDSSPAPSTASRASGRKASKDMLDRAAVGQQMLTSNEIYERRRARKLLEHKRGALEEAVERRVCEEIYDRIWRHRSTLDEMRDEKLRSRTAGLSVMGIGLKELGIDLTLEPQSEEWIAKARASLCEMDKFHYPLGKLQSLAAAHQSIVELLASCHQGSSSADEILPTLIFVLIGSPVDQMNLISNLNFVQRFRTASKINGEAAYCLTNLEAAITFIETVDIASLGQDDPAPGSKQTAGAAGAEVAAGTSPKRPPLHKSSPSQSSLSKPTKPPSSLTIEIKSSPPASPAQIKRPLSALFQPQAALGAAGDAVRSTADEGIRNIGSALDKSFSFMFGRLREHSVSSSGTNPTGTVIVAPKTLDDARKLVSPKTMIEEDGLLSENSSIMETEEPPAKEKDDRIIGMIAGTRVARERSTDSAGSTESGRKRLVPAQESRTSSNTATLGVSPPAPGAVETMKSLGNSFNPLNRFAGMNVMKGFNRSSPAPVSPTPPPEVGSSTNLATTPYGKIDPPIQQFLEMTDPLQLRLGEVALLLKDYQRLADVVKTKGLL